MIFFDQLFEDGFGLLHLVLGRGRIDHHRIQNLSSGVHHCQLTAGPKGRVPSKYNLSRDRGLHQKLLQILAKHLDGAGLSLLCQIIAHLPLDGWRDQAGVAVCHYLL